MRGHFLTVDPPTAMCVSTLVATPSFTPESILSTVASLHPPTDPLF